MINAGEINRLTINRQTDNGIYLADEEGNEVLLPNRYVPEQQSEGWAQGDAIDVFVYFDSEDRIVATTDTPKIMVGQVAPLRVAATTRFGAFMDWGLPKDLFIPLANQPFRLEEGKIYMISIYVDRTTGRLVGSTKIGKYFDNETITVRPREQVTIQIAQQRDRGYRVIINNAHWGMLYDNQIFQDVEIGDILTGWVIKITDDNRIDVSLQQQGMAQVKVATDIVMELLIENGGVLPIGDKSSPELVQATVGMSKKVFKKAVGFLMRNGKVQAGDNSTSIIEK